MTLARFTAPDGRGLAYVDSGGSGPAVLCLAGLTRNHRDFDPLARHLAPRYRVVRLDSRGRGGSDRAEDPAAEYTIPVEAEDARALLDHLGLATAAIIGTSRGGILGMAIAAAEPDRVDALVLNDIGAVVEAEGLARIAAYLGWRPDWPDLNAAAQALMGANAPAFPDVPLARWRVHAQAICRTVGGRAMLDIDPRLGEAVAEAMQPEEGGIELWPLFESLAAIPILTIRGANSDILSADTVARMAQIHPQMDYVEIANRGHAPFLDEPAALSAIDRFLERFAR